MASSESLLLLPSRIWAILNNPGLNQQRRGWHNSCYFWSCFQSVIIQTRVQKPFDHQVSLLLDSYRWVFIWIFACASRPLISFYLIYKSDLEPCYQGEFKPGLGLGSDPGVKDKLQVDAWLLWNWQCPVLSTDFHNFPGRWFSGYTSACSTVDILIPSAWALFTSCALPSWWKGLFRISILTIQAVILS